MENRDDLVTLAEAARRVVKMQLAPSMSRQRIYQLADTDPQWPVPRDEWIRAGQSYLVPWSRLESYFQDRAGNDDLVSFREIARRAVSLGIMASLTHPTVSRWASTDPAWPVPREEWAEFGRDYRVPWSKVRPYLLKRAASGRAHTSGGSPN